MWRISTLLVVYHQDRQSSLSCTFHRKRGNILQSCQSTWPSEALSSQSGASEDIGCIVMKSQIRESFSISWRHYFLRRSFLHGTARSRQLRIGPTSANVGWRQLEAASLWDGRVSVSFAYVHDDVYYVVFV